MPILLKGILHPDDARLAVEHGIDGEIGAGRVPVLFDSGIRGVSDVVKALALGARAVLLGRPYAYGLAIAGETGVREVIRNVLAELDVTLGLAECVSVGELTSEVLVRSPLPEDVGDGDRR